MIRVTSYSAGSLPRHRQSKRSCGFGKRLRFNANKCKLPCHCICVDITFSRNWICNNVM
ncbi:hypothetical protein M5D96_001186 [Drosophila gunungcola]|uniref:Uncharacterized protein n=1 Tax=Drosophila gunungcola TaxID=103775 RepID=A0A9P9YXN1_9MUSC|nr:hypothetical protein M5D96_001186 [Drosophila gunungcola]